MVGRHGRVEAEHLGAGTDQRGAVPQAGEFGIEHRPHRLPIEAASQFETGGEGWEIVVYHNVQKSTKQRINESHHSMRSFAIRATPASINPASRAAAALSGSTITPASRSFASCWLNGCGSASVPQTDATKTMWRPGLR